MNPSFNVRKPQAWTLELFSLYFSCNFLEVIGCASTFYFSEKKKKINIGFNEYPAVALLTWLSLVWDYNAMGTTFGVQISLLWANCWISPKIIFKCATSGSMVLIMSRIIFLAIYHYHSWWHQESSSTRLCYRWCNITLGLILMPIPYVPDTYFGLQKTRSGLVF